MSPSEARKLVARNIRSLAKRRGVALTILADLAGTSRSQLFAVLAQQTSPTIDWLAKVSTALDVDPSELLARGRPGAGVNRRAR